jgi:Universal stress protein family
MQHSSLLDRPAGPDPSSSEPGRATRGPARLLVSVDGSASSTRQLVWALQEAARRQATVLAVAVLDAGADDATRAATRILLEAQLRHATGQTGVHGRAQTALLDPAVYQALTGTAGGADLVVVGPHRTAVLRPATRRPPVRRPLVRAT